MKLTIYTGRAKPAVAVGKNQCRALGFAEQYPGWHTIGKDRASRRAVEGLLRRGCVETNDLGQYRFAPH